MIRSTWRQLSSMIDRPHRWLASVTAAGILVGLVEGVVLAAVVRVALGMTGGSSSTWTAPLANWEISSGGLLWIAVSGASMVTAIHIFIARASARAGADVLFTTRRQAVEAFGRATWDRQEREREGALQETVASLAGQSAQLANVLAIGLSSLLSLLALLVLAVVIDPVAMVLVSATGLALGVALRPLTGLTRRRSTAYVKANSSFAEDVGQMTGLAQEHRVFGVQERAAQRLVDASRDVAGMYMQVKFVQRLGWSVYRDVAMLLLIAAVAVLYVVDQGSLLGTGTVIVLIVRAMTSAQSVQRGLQSLHELGPNLDEFDERVGALLVERSETGDAPLVDIGVIELRDVSYTYQTNERGPRPDALHCVDLRIEPGEVLGIVGPSGAGKSTLVQILLRLRQPTSGSVVVNDRSYESYRAADWSRLVTLVPQEPHLMEGSVAENIQFLREDIDDDTVRRSATAAHVASEILALPDGFDTLLGPRGVGLSGGQKQRLALARALAGQPRLIVLDEPTSALDSRSEQLIVETIRELAGSVTLVIVAHRASTLAACDRLLLLRDGRVDRFAAPGEFARPIGVAE